MEESEGDQKCVRPERESKKKWVTVERERESDSGKIKWKKNERVGSIFCHPPLWLYRMLHYYVIECKQLPEGSKLSSRRVEHVMFQLGGGSCVCWCVRVRCACACVCMWFWQIIPIENEFIFECEWVSGGGGGGRGSAFTVLATLCSHRFMFSQFERNAEKNGNLFTKSNVEC